ncbi:OmpA family protein [Halarcobacter ebronensis]|uniref:OmpA-like domain-containing protein n=1 Tax=Halarcobacter ebronensis TaxID=1462615 RepID=A0A4Q1ANZ2_9BACT|nr:OmpA family protein [Halarcobacter ebronensis]QKF81878.1 OmpA domain-containing protein [Halarcobacter ebronensis]RXK02144.1 hypothetical protein CRV07_14115 [Halarcobacter ebronensis]
MENRDNNTNFWISYADLMAGLLFVFILLIGAIIVKYALLQDESNSLEARLKKERLALEKSKEELALKEDRLKNIVSELNKSEYEVLKLQEETKELNEKLKYKLLENEQLKLSIDEKIKLLQEFNLSKEELENRLAKLEKENKELIEKRESLNKLIVDQDEKYAKLEKENEAKLDVLVKESLDKEKLIELFKKKNQELEDEMKVIKTRLNDSQKDHLQLVTELENTKKKIKNLTGIKIRVITLLKEKLGKNIKIDPKSGNLTLSSNVLFDEGKSELKANSKVFLKNAVYDYFQTILSNDEINKYIDKIFIVGHTNSVGTFLYNLDLSQKRALSVMEFLLSLEFKNKEKLKELLVASGRSYLDPINDKDGKEDKEASRRIEIKLNIKNEEAIKEIESILE